MDNNYTANGDSDPIPSDTEAANDQPNPTFMAQGNEGIYIPPAIDPGDTPEAGDVDPGSTASADETGQSGDVTQAKKNTANDWNG